MEEFHLLKKIKFDLEKLDLVVIMHPNKGHVLCAINKNLHYRIYT